MAWCFCLSGTLLEYRANEQEGHQVLKLLRTLNITRQRVFSALVIVLAIIHIVQDVLEWLATYVLSYQG